MPNLNTILIEKQVHPGLSGENPFDVTWLYASHASENYLGDMHYALQLCIVLHGSMEVVYDGVSRVCNAGECWWTMCWEPHACRVLANRSFTVAINLDLNALMQCDPFGNCPWLLPFMLPPELRFFPKTAEQRKEFLETGKRLFHWHTKQPRFWKQKSWIKIQSLLLEALNRISGNDADVLALSALHGSNIARLQPAIELARSASHAPVMLAQAAALCSLSPSRFSEIFRNTMGSSFGQFAARARLGQAAREVVSTQLSLEEIADRWGFFDSSHFCHAFKKIYQCSPSEFRLRNVRRPLR